MKDKIKRLIEAGELIKAKELLDKYEENYNDIETYSMKAVIAIMENKLDEAEEILKKGLRINKADFDLLYNLAYVYKLKNELQLASDIYTKALDFAPSTELEKEIKEILEDLDYPMSKSKKKRVLMIAHIFPPMGGSGVQRTLKFAKYLGDYGWEPVIVTAGKTIYPHKDKSLVEEIPDNIEIIRIDEDYNINKQILNELLNLYRGIVNDPDIIHEYAKILKNSNFNIQNIIMPELYFLWANNVLKQLNKKVNMNTIDLIYTTSWPYSDHVIGYYLKSKYNKPWVADFRDEWTNNPYANYDKNGLRYKLEYSMEKKIVDTADKVITTTPLSSENYRKIFNLKEEKVVTITNGYDEEDFEDIDTEKTNMNKKFTIIHNGLLYGIRTPVTFLKAVKSLVDEELVSQDEIEIQFTENKDNEWGDFVKELQLDKIVKFIGQLNHKESLINANKADVLLLIVGPGEKNKAMYPGKIFEYLRLKKPILSLAPQNGVVDNLIKENKSGFNIDFCNTDGMKRCILKLYKAWQNKNYSLPDNEDIKRFERKNLTKRISEVFDTMTNNNRINELEKEIRSLIDKGNLDRAKTLLDKNKELNNPELYSMKSIIAIMENKLDEAERFIQDGLTLDSNNFDLLFNLGYVYEKKEDIKKAMNIYSNAKKYAESEDQKKDICQALERLSDYEQELNISKGRKIAFLLLPGADKFIDDIIEGLSSEYQTQKIIVNYYSQIDKWMEWADIVWFDWCDQLAIYGSKLDIAKEKKIIMRVHSYEAFTNNIFQVKWQNIDKTIFVAEHIKEYVLDQVKDLQEDKVVIIPNGVNINKFTFKERQTGFNIAYVGLINFKKGPMLLLHSFKALYEQDNRYKLYIAGKFEEPRYVLYFNQMIKEMELENNVIYQGWQKDINTWLEDKNYIISTSVLESQHLAIMEAMTKGIKPLIHNFVGAKSIYPKKYIWSTIDDLLSMVISEKYNSKEYCSFVKENYSFFDTFDDIKKLLLETDLNSEKQYNHIYNFKYDQININFYLPNLNDHIQKLIYYNRNFYEEAMLKDIKERLNPGSFIIDVGANVGNHTVYFAKICNASKVYSFEPQKDVFKILEKNVWLNGITNQVELFDYALGDKESLGSLKKVDNNNLGMTKVYYDLEGTIKIRVLDEILFGAIENLDLIKIDVEDMGFQVIRGARRLINQFKPLIYIEANSNNEFNKVKEFLERFNYIPLLKFNATPTYLFYSKNTSK
jgi:FkbM family methyltransferase